MWHRSPALREFPASYSRSLRTGACRTSIHNSLVYSLTQRFAVRFKYDTLRCMWGKNAALAVTLEDRKELNRIVRAGKTEQRIALRARIVLGAADGRSNNALAKELKTSRPTVI